jgi:hypothetical protein
MKHSTYLFLSLVAYSLLILAAAAAAAAVTNNNKEFIATHEWQKIEEGQAIPAGLHVRVDMSSGLKMARLNNELDDYDAKNEALVVVDGARQDKNTQYALPQPNPDELTSSPSFSSESSRSARLRELAKYFTPTADIDSIQQLIAICLDNNSDAVQVELALENIESYLHQIDNARDFITVGGLDIVMNILDTSHDGYLHHNTTDSTEQQQLLQLLKLQTKAAHVVGTMNQNNDEVKQFSTKDGAIFTLVKLLNNTIDSQLSAAPAVEVDKEILRLQGKLLYSLSAIIRSNSVGQGLFNDFNGLHSLTQLFNVIQQQDASEDGERQKLLDTVQFKIIDLFNDLLADHILNHTGNEELFQQIISLQSIRLVGSALDASLMSSSSRTSSERLLPISLNFLTNVLHVNQANKILALNSFRTGLQKCWKEYEAKEEQQKNEAINTQLQHLITQINALPSNIHFKPTPLHDVDVNTVRITLVPHITKLQRNEFLKQLQQQYKSIQLSDGLSVQLKFDSRDYSSDIRLFYSASEVLSYHPSLQLTLVEVLAVEMLVESIDYHYKA